MTTGRELFVPRQHGLGSYLMFARTTLILLDAKPSRHSTNALVAALETDADFDSLELRLPAGEVQLAQHLEESLTVGKRPIVGLSFTTLGLGRMGELMVRMTGRFGDRALWVAGGPHPTADPQGMLRLGFDVVVRGEGEAILLDLLKTAASRGDIPFSSMAWNTFSNTTIASSMTTPTMSTRASMVELLRVKSSAFIMANVATIEAGIAKAAMSVDRQERMNSKTTRVAMMLPTMRCFCTSCMAA